MTDIGKELQFHLCDLLYLLAFHHLALLFGACLLALVHLTPDEEQNGYRHQGIDAVHRYGAIEWWSHIDG